MIVELYTSAFCGPCRTARTVLGEAVRLVPGVAVEEVDVAQQVERAERASISSTPTVLVRGADGGEVFRAAGVPTLPQVLVAIDHAARAAAPTRP